MNTRSLSIISCTLMLLGVGLGAFGAHALEDKLSESQQVTWNTATLYLFVHSLGALVLLLSRRMQGTPLLHYAATLMLIGVLLFSGSLYLLCLAPGMGWLGPVTPIGGVAFIASWILAIVGFLKNNE